MSFSNASWMGSDTIAGDQSVSRFFMTFSRAVTLFVSEFFSITAKYSDSGRTSSPNRSVQTTIPSPRGSKITARSRRPKTTRDTPTTS
ncbi:hypothetical protein D3C71_1569280 [compost metagenome]